MNVAQSNVETLTLVVKLSRILGGIRQRCSLLINSRQLLGDFLFMQLALGVYLTGEMTDLLLLE